MDWLCLTEAVSEVERNRSNRNILKMISCAPRWMPRRKNEVGMSVLFLMRFAVLYSTKI